MTIVYVAMEGSHEGPIERKPVGLKANALRKGHLRADSLEDSFVEREPGETVEALIARAERDHPEVFMWVTCYEQDRNEIVKPSNPTVGA